MYLFFKKNSDTLFVFFKVENSFKHLFCFAQQFSKEAIIWFEKIYLCCLLLIWEIKGKKVCPKSYGNICFSLRISFEKENIFLLGLGPCVKCKVAIFFTVAPNDEILSLYRLPWALGFARTAWLLSFLTHFPLHAKARLWGPTDQVFQK